MEGTRLAKGGLTRLKLAIAVASGLFSIYMFIQSLMIASAGVSYQVPQLEGDGGGGLVIAFTCALASGLLFLRLWLANVGFLVAATGCLLVGGIFQDSVIMLWGLVPLLLAGLTAWKQFRDSRRRNHRQGGGETRSTSRTSL